MTGINVNEAYIEPADFWRADLRDGANINAIGDYSITETPFEVTVAGPGVHLLRRMGMLMAWTGPGAIDDYGPITGGLAAGIRVATVTGAGQTILTDTPITNVLELGLFASAPEALPEAPAVGGLKVIGVQWDLRDLAYPLILQAGDSFQVLLNDNFTSLAHHRFAVTGNRSNRALL